MLNTIYKLMQLAHMEGQKHAGKTPDVNAAREYVENVRLQQEAATKEEAMDGSDNCYVCMYKQDVPGNAHIACTNPDSNMTGDPYGIRSGWFLYPLLFDPNWKTRKCRNFKLYGS